MKDRLDNLLVKRKLVPTRSQAESFIMAGKVVVEGKLATKPGHQHDMKSKIVLKETHRYVSRAALKLESITPKLKLDFKHNVVLDVGSSTGGFTDFALQHGAKKVYAVDVGTNQLDYKLRQDQRVIVMEKTDIRSVSELPEKIDIAVVDVSFISLKLVLPVLPKFMKKESKIVAMAKPQFEADKKTADLHKGVIKNNTIRRRILTDLEMWLKQHFQIVSKADSEVAGAKGNLERFYLLKPLKK